MINYSEKLQTKYLEQIEKIKSGQKKLNIIKPAVINSGIVRIQDEDPNELISLYKAAVLAGRFSKFVPASGAATRMSKKLLTVFSKVNTFDQLKSEAEMGNNDAQFALTFLEGIRKFAFIDDLESILSEENSSVSALINSNKLHELFEFVLEEKGLNLSHLPKALLKFHKYSNEVRTAFEEHIYEGNKLISDFENCVRMHFTVPAEHEKAFGESLLLLSKKYSEYKLMVQFSAQDSNTDTIALTMDDVPVFTENNLPLLRAGGHGSLLINLNNTKGDLVFIKNVDNVGLHTGDDTILHYKKLLAGYLIKIQKQMFYYLNLLSTRNPDQSVFDTVAAFVNEKLNYLLKESFNSYSTRLKTDYLIKILRRPLRVCGMVENTGEPGGGPFWVKDINGNTSLQIVEQAQFQDDQLNVLKNSTHFNPVDMVCAMRNENGENFYLPDYCDNDAYIVTLKSYKGMDIKVLEHPGLWNGGMAYWNTVFVEVPVSTFTPVKEVNDLLKPEHQQ